MRSGIFGVAVATLSVVGSSLASAQAPRSPDRTGAARQAQPTQPSVQVTSSLNRTAVWVGDPILWTVELICPPTVDVIPDDLAGDKLELTGLELVGSEMERTAREDGFLIYRVWYHLRSFEVGAPVLRTSPLSVRYYVRRAGQRAEDLTPAGQVQVPGVVLAWRSTIPEKVEALELREGRTAEQMPALLRAARPVGLGLVLISVAPVALWGVSKLRQSRRPRERGPSPRASRNEVLSALESLRAADTATDEERREAYGRLNTALRRYIADTTGVPAQALTAEQVAERLQQRGSRLSADAVAEVLAECDRARYGTPGILPTSDQFRESVAATERFV